MKAITVQENGMLQVEELPVPQLEAPDELLVKVAYAGLCGSDIPRIFAKGAHFYPMILGHEFSGTVAEVGTEITDLTVGDPIACAPLTPCFECDSCQKGYYSLCRNYGFIGSRSFGGFAEYVKIKRCNAFRLSAQTSLRDGAFIEPITVGLHAMQLCQGCKDKNVVIVGAGTIGLLALQAAKALGAHRITAIDINPAKLALAQSLGATQVIHSQEQDAKSIYAQLHDVSHEQLVLETAGSPHTVKLCLALAQPRAQISLVGTLHQELNLSYAEFSQILRKELLISGSWMNYSAPYPGKEWEIAAEMFSKQQIAIDPLIHSCGGFDAFCAEVSALQGQPMTGKILLSCDSSH